MENNESTIMEKLAYLEGTKDSIKNAIIAQGQEVSADDTFRSYAQKIANIETGMNTYDATITNLDVLKGKIAYNSTGRVEGRIRTFEDNTNVAMPIHSMARNDDNEEIIKVCNLDEDVDMVWMTDILSDGNTQFRKMLPISLNIVSNLISENLRDKAVYIDYFAYPYMGDATNVRHAYDILVSDATGRNTNNRADIHVVDSINYDIFCVEANCTNLTTEEMASSRYSKYMNWYRLEIMTNDYNFVPLNNSFNLSISFIGDHWYSQWMPDSAFYYAYSTTNIYTGVNYKGTYYRQPGSAFSPYLQKQLVPRSGAAYIGNNVNAFTAINLPLLANADGITPNKIAEGEKILGIEGTFQGGEDLSAELAAQEQKLAELEAALENKTAGGEVKLNVYAQTTEPTDKDGIWLQTDKAFDKIYFDEHVKRITVEGWDTVTQYPNISSASASYQWGFPTVLVGDYIYIFNGSSSKKPVKYNIVTNEIIELDHYQPGELVMSTGIKIDNYIYIGPGLSSDTMYKYDIENDTYTQYKTVTSKRGAYLTYYNGFLYLIGGGTSNSGGKTIHKIDLSTDTYTKLSIECPYNLSSFWCSPISIGSSVYIMGFYYNGSNIANDSAYVLDLEEEKFTQLTDVPQSGSSRWGGYIAGNDGNYIYIFGKGSGGTGYSGQYCYRYDITTDSYTQLNNIPSSFQCGGKAFYKNNKIVLVPGTPSNMTATIRAYALTYDSVYSYENNSVIIWDGFGKYKTQMTQSAENQEGKIQTLFYDVYHYTTENGLDDTIPTYYGDGTQWINFKNPPSNS